MLIKDRLSELNVLCALQGGSALGIHSAFKFNVYQGRPGRSVFPDGLVKQPPIQTILEDRLSRHSRPRSAKSLMLKLFVVLIVYLFILPTLASAQTDGQLRSTIDLIVIHTIGGPSCKNSRVVFPTIAGDVKRWLTYFEDHETIGIHYVIGRKGETLPGIPENEIAYHAYGNNQTSIGIELINNGDGSDPFPPGQISALVKLLRELCSRYGLSVDKIKGHEEIDKRIFQCGSSSFKEKVDPGLAFPWHEVREALSTLSLPSSPIVTKDTGLD